MAGSAGNVQTLGPLSFETRPHEFLSIVGTSGCGKTTLLRTIAGLLEPTRGSVEIVCAGPGVRVFLVCPRVASDLRPKELSFAFWSAASLSPRVFRERLPFAGLA